MEHRKPQSLHVWCGPVRIFAIPNGPYVVVPLALPDPPIGGKGIATVPQRTGHTERARVDPSTHIHPSFRPGTLGQSPLTKSERAVCPWPRTRPSPPRPPG